PGESRIGILKHVTVRAEGLWHGRFAYLSVSRPTGTPVMPEQILTRFPLDLASKLLYEKGINFISEADFDPNVAFNEVISQSALPNQSATGRVTLKVKGFRIPKDLMGKPRDIVEGKLKEAGLLPVPVRPTMSKTAVIRHVACGSKTYNEDDGDLLCAKGEEVWISDVKLSPETIPLLYIGYYVEFNRAENRIEVK